MRQKTQVLVVGAGPVGQGLAIELGQRGIACPVIEKNPRIGVASRAKTTNVRTREHFRRWGIADALRDAAPFGVDYPSNIAFTTRMSGHLLARFDNALYCAPGRNPIYSEHAQWIPQYTVERVMRQHLVRFGRPVGKLCQGPALSPFHDLICPQSACVHAGAAQHHFTLARDLAQHQLHAVITLWHLLPAIGSQLFVTGRPAVRHSLTPSRVLRAR